MSKYIFAVAIFFLLLSALSMISGHQGFAVKVLAICYWIFSGGFVIYLFECYEK